MVKVAAAELEQENKTAYHVEAVTPRIPFGFAFVKRASDILVSLLVATLGFLPMLVIAVLIKLDSEGPVIFKQERLGKDGKPFTMYKFRSMRLQTVEDEAKGWTVKNDPRVTGIGKFMRKTSIDELPQLINILKGDMSFVGPRPLIPQETEIRELREKYNVFSVRPGITGWAQVNGRNSITWEDKFRYDVWYVRNISFILDVKILFKTAVTVLKRDNVYTNEEE